MIYIYGFTFVCTVLLFVPLCYWIARFSLFNLWTACCVYACTMQNAVPYWYTTCVCISISICTMLNIFLMKCSMVQCHQVTAILCIDTGVCTGLAAVFLISLIFLQSTCLVNRTRYTYIDPNTCNTMHIVSVVYSHVNYECVCVQILVCTDTHTGIHTLDH